jgi:hypothetical protein
VSLVASAIKHCGYTQMRRVGIAHETTTNRNIASENYHSNTIDCQFGMIRSIGDVRSLYLGVYAKTPKLYPSLGRLKIKAVDVGWALPTSQTYAEQ